MAKRRQLASAQAQGRPTAALQALAHPALQNMLLPEQRAVLPAPAAGRQPEGVEQHRRGDERGEQDDEEGKEHDLHRHLAKMEDCVGE